MKQSQLFTKTLREPPKDEVSINAKLLVRAGFIDKLAAGIYTFLPLGLKVLKKIENIIRQEMIAIGGQEILMPALNPKENWQTTGRWENFDALFKSKGPQEQDYALAPTHEEVVAPLAKKFVFSYKDLPLYLFHIQTKFRKEIRTKSGLVRTREFSMKDLYSFHTDQSDLDQYYEIVRDAYFKTFERCGLKDKTYLTLASGGTFSKYSHEFQTLTEGGEDTIHICQACDLAINDEIKPETSHCPDCGGKNFKEAKAVEVGNIFKLGTKYSSPFNFKFRDQKGEEKTVVMGCYGIGPGRVMGTIVEASHDQAGIIWPTQVAPFQAHLLVLVKDQNLKKEADVLYEKLTQQGLEILYDDRQDVSAGEKFAEADLIGIPWRLVISEKTLKNDSVEAKRRNKNEAQLFKVSDLKKLIDLIGSPASD